MYWMFCWLLLLINVIISPLCYFTGRSLHTLVLTTSLLLSNALWFLQALNSETVEVCVQSKTQTNIHICSVSPCTFEKAVMVSMGGERGTGCPSKEIKSVFCCSLLLVAVAQRTPSVTTEASSLLEDQLLCWLLKRIQVQTTCLETFFSDSGGVDWQKEPEKSHFSVNTSFCWTAANLHQGVVSGHDTEAHGQGKKTNKKKCFQGHPFIFQNPLTREKSCAIRRSTADA